MSFRTNEKKNAPALELPPAAPQIRITAGAGTASQKTWNLRRPVTLIGSRRPAHIVLHDKAISNAHCVIVNTGTHILVKDLHTESGTKRNNQRFSIAELHDGDVLQIGANSIQVAIQAGQRWAGRASDPADDPLALPNPESISLFHTDATWDIKDALTVIGSHPLALIHLNHEEVSKRHALLFRFSDRLAIFDLVGHESIHVNGLPTPVGILRKGDRVRVGPLTLLIGEKPVVLDESEGSTSHSTDAASSTVESLKTAEQLGDTLEVLEGNIADSWNKLNQWQSQLFENANALSQQEIDLTERELELDARDAALRGQLHDVARLQEQLTVRENEFKVLQAKQTADEIHLSESLEISKQTELDHKQRIQDLTRREHAFAQRWMKMQDASCPHCGLALYTSDLGEPVL